MLKKVFGMLILTLAITVLAGFSHETVGLCGQTNKGVLAASHGQQTALAASVSLLKSTPLNDVEDDDIDEEDYEDEDKKKPYRLNASVEEDDDQYILRIRTNLRLSIKNYNGPPVEGEGHIHFYLNGKLIGPIVDKKPFKLTNLVEGKNKIRLVLAQNNHWETYGVVKELTVEKDSD
ncbi:hypothetical protein [Paenibacillus agilis]|uniref:CHRD domain-containing protein n=1 Tax=Paenibacillus agilis TaxID=3020863 RepID=A0A559IPV6_9BACL|nr:hypothetical protein [Paenibacillus agilis]TVX89671.1 hypothetical protein FPZ44_18075 [Paenibacillus agilis]